MRGPHIGGRAATITSILIFKIRLNIAVQFEVQRRTTVRYSLSFYGTLGFIGGFFGARLFATLNPTVTVQTGGIHFHHFWYGLFLVVVTGWLGIAMSNDRLSRVLASLFGLGVGFIGDEVGLLLTFRDYTSELTVWFFAGAISSIILLTLILRFERDLKADVFGVSSTEHLTHLGIFLAAFSTIFFAFDSLVPGIAFAGLGILIFLLGFEMERRPRSLHPFG